MIKLKAVKEDKGNCCLFCVDQDGGKWVLVNINTSNNPTWVPHDYTNDGEPCSPIKNGIDWELVENDIAYEYYVGMSNVINTMEDMQAYCVEQYNNHPDEDFAQYYLFFEGIDKERFNERYKQVRDLKKACDESAKLSQDCC